MSNLFWGCHLTQYSQFFRKYLVGFSRLAGCLFFAGLILEPAMALGAEKAPPPALSKDAANSAGINLPDLPSGDALNIPSLPPGVFNNDPSQLEAQAEAAAAKAAEDEQKAEQEHNQKSFKTATQNLLPLSPDQIRSFMRQLENMQEAAQAPSSGPPIGKNKVVSLSLDPGGEPPTIKLAGGYVTTIDILDMTGAPWPILDVGIGGNFEVTPTQAGSHVVRVAPLTRVATGNISILLKNLNTPVIFRLSAGDTNFDMRYDVQVPRLGPNAKPPLIDRGRTGPTAGDQNIMMVLENAPPSGAVKLKVAGLDDRTKAWQMNEKVFVRTPLTMLSPAWNASVTSTDGMTVYEIGNAPVLIMSDNGAMVRARLLRDDDHDK